MTAQSPIQWETVGSRGRKPQEGEVQPHLCQKCQRSSAEWAEFKGAEWAESKGQAAGPREHRSSRVVNREPSWRESKVKTRRWMILPARCLIERFSSRCSADRVWELREVESSCLGTLSEHRWDQEFQWVLPKVSVRWSGPGSWP